MDDGPTVTIGCGLINPFFMLDFFSINLKLLIIYH